MNKPKTRLEKVIKDALVSKVRDYVQCHVEILIDCGDLEMAVEHILDVRASDFLTEQECLLVAKHFPEVFQACLKDPGISYYS